MGSDRLVGIACIVRSDCVTGGQGKQRCAVQTEIVGNGRQRVGIGNILLYGPASAAKRTQQIERLVRTGGMQRGDDQFRTRFT